MTPLQIEIALHYHYGCGDYDPPRLNAPAVQDALEGFVRAGLLRPSTIDGQQYEGVPEPLRMYATALGRVPLPRLDWIIPASHA